MVDGTDPRGQYGQCRVRQHPVSTERARPTTSQKFDTRQSWGCYGLHRPHNTTHDPESKVRGHKNLSQHGHVMLSRTIVIKNHNSWHIHEQILNHYFLNPLLTLYILVWDSFHGNEIHHCGPSHELKLLMLFFFKSF